MSAVADQPGGSEPGGKCPEPAAFSCAEYRIVRRPFAFCTDRFDIYDTNKRQLAYAVNEGASDAVELYCYADRGRHTKLLEVKQQRDADWDRAFRVTDLTHTVTVGWLFRREFRSFVQSRWDLTDPQRQVLAVVDEQYLPVSCLRRLCSPLPVARRYRLLTSWGAELARLRYFGYTLHVAVQLIENEGRPVLDPRLILAVALLLCAADAPEDTAGG
ncbi:hypothetical protein JW859_08695 [bacterium]|nr:hypothetical protein [bacterium]